MVVVATIATGSRRRGLATWIEATAATIAATGPSTMPKSSKGMSPSSSETVVPHAAVPMPPAITITLATCETAGTAREKHPVEATERAIEVNSRNLPRLGRMRTPPFAVAPTPGTHRR